MLSKIVFLVLIVALTAGIGGYFRSQQTQDGGDRYLQDINCVAEEAQYCNSMVCITSPLRDCQDRCHRAAVEYCEAGNDKQGIRLKPRHYYPWLE